MAERSSDAVPVPPTQPTERAPSEAMRIRLALDLTQGAKRVDYLAFDEARIIDVVTSKRRGHKLFGKGESLSDISLYMYPIFEFSIREIKKKLIRTHFNDYTVLVDAISGEILSANGVHRRSSNLDCLIGLSAYQLRLMDFILSNKGVSYAKLHEAFPEQRLKTRLKPLERKGLISVNDEHYYPLHDIRYPKPLKTRRADSLQLKSGRADSVRKPYLQKKELEEVIRGLYGCGVFHTRIIYSPIVEVSYASEESNRRVCIDGLTGNVVRST